MLRNASDVTDHGIGQLVAIPGLTHLALIDLTVTGQALQSIAGFPALVSLDVRMCDNISGDQLTALRRAPRLRELKLGGQAVDDAALAIVAYYPRLESLTVEDAPITGEGLHHLATSGPASRRIHTLAFARCPSLSDEALTQLSSFGQLRRLDLRDMPVTGEFLAALTEPEQLEVLILNQTFLGDEAFRAIARCQGLERLEVAQNFLTPEAMQHIGSLVQLRYLNLSGCGLNDQMLQPLQGLEHLSTLIVDGNPEVTQPVRLTK
jgi:hypothetical protein